MNGPVASLNTAWFALIGLLWTGYLVLEGFDFGVGVLSLAIGRDDLDRQLARNAIGPVWDGNEVWLIVAAGATFAAFGGRDHVGQDGDRGEECERARRAEQQQMQQCGGQERVHRGSRVPEVVGRFRG